MPSISLRDCALLLLLNKKKIGYNLFHDGLYYMSSRPCRHDHEVKFASIAARG
jgi:hypothetical protein